MKVEGFKVLGICVCVLFLGACSARKTATPTFAPLSTDMPAPEPSTLTATPALTATATPIPVTITPATPTPEISFPAPGLIHDLHWDAAGSQLAIAAGTDIHLYDASLREQHVIPLGVWTERLAFYPSRAIFGAALKDGTVRFWDSTTGAEMCKFTAHSKGANSFSFQPGGSLIATTGTDIISRTWDISSVLAGGCKVKAVGQLIGSSYTAPDVTFSADGQRLALVDGNDIYLRESETRKLIAVLHGDLVIFDLAFSPDGRWLAAAQSNATVTFWDLSTSPKPVPTLLNLPASSAKSYSWRVDFSADGSLMAGATSDGEVIVWQLADLQPVFSRSLGHPIAGLAFNPATSALTVGTLDGSVYVYAVK